MTTFGNERVIANVVKQVQTKLNLLHIVSPPLAVDGILGPKTIAAIVSFQRCHDQAETGVIDNSLLESLGLIHPSFSGDQVVLPDTRTPLSPLQAAQAFNDGYWQVTGQAPSASILGLLLAQSAFETGNWGQGIHNFNFGNAKASSNNQYVQYFRCSEIVDGEEVYYDPPSDTSDAPPSVCKFAAFLTASDGASAYIRLLKGRPNWWKGLQTGTVHGFNQGLISSPAYYTADPQIYEAGLNALFTKYLPLASSIAGSSSGSSSPLGSLAKVGVAVGLGYFAYRHQDRIASFVNRKFHKKVFST